MYGRNQVWLHAKPVVGPTHVSVPLREWRPATLSLSPLFLLSTGLQLLSVPPFIGPMLSYPSAWFLSIYICFLYLLVCLLLPRACWGTSLPPHSYFPGLIFFFSFPFCFGIISGRAQSLFLGQHSSVTRGTLWDARN